MDLGIAGRTALLCGASRGLGLACAERLAENGVNIVLAARGGAELETVCARIHREHNVATRFIVADMTNAADRAQIAAECPAPDIFVTSGGWPNITVPPDEWTNAMWHVALESMLLAPIDLFARLSPGMVQRRFGRIVAVTSRLIKQPEFMLAMPSAARLGLTGYVKAISRKLAPHNVTVNTILPGIFDTARQIEHTRGLAQAHGKTDAEIVAERAVLTPAGRFGRPREFSALCAYVCSADASFLTGQALVIDGGAHPGIW